MAFQAGLPLMMLAPLQILSLSLSSPNCPCSEKLCQSNLLAPCKQFWLSWFTLLQQDWESHRFDDRSAEEARMLNRNAAKCQRLTWFPQHSAAATTCLNFEFLGRRNCHLFKRGKMRSAFILLSFWMLIAHSRGAYVGESSGGLFLIIMPWIPKSLDFILDSACIQIQHGTSVNNWPS